MAKKIKNIIVYMFLSVGTAFVFFGGAALDSEDIILPIKICSVGIALLFVSVLILNSKKINNAICSKYDAVDSDIAEDDENQLE